ncbi:hypothetical protein QMT40_002978 [Parvibaculaceae bacterium PLY_AMNH_Bact1]|nr:hypothetical protein QMT40_002978 [Parvibaculaceae bacterium PLY_AMNH_Bact1]
MSYNATEQAAIDRLKTKYNSNAYDPATNPGGFANDGHQENFPAALEDTGTVGQAVGDKADEAAASEATATTQAGIATTKAGEATASEATATTQAGIATTKAGEAAASEATATTGQRAAAIAQAGIATTKAGEAAASEATATTQAGIATTKAGEAATSETNATTKAGEAATSETNAGNSALAAAGSASDADDAAAAAVAALAAANLPAPIVNDRVLVTEGGAYVFKTFEEAKALLLPGTAGECRLEKDGANLRLNPYNGNLLTIDGAAYTIPAAGVALAATGLTIDTDHYIYAYMNSSTMTLEASTTAHATDATTGVEIKTGDSTRTLVGLARPIAGPAWVDSETQRFVRSWFNRKASHCLNAFTTARSTTATSWSEVHTEIRCEFLAWSDEVVAGNLNSYAFVNGSNMVYHGISFDGGDVETGASASLFGSTGGAIGGAVSKSGLSEGYHYATLSAYTAPGFTCTFGHLDNVAGLSLTVGL